MTGPRSFPARGLHVQARKLEAIGRLSGGIAHDLNNLLTIIIGNLELLVADIADPADSAELAHEALEAALAGADLTRRLLTFTRRESLTSQESSLNVVVTGMAGMLARGLGENIKLELALAGDLWPVLVDRAELESAIINIVSNAKDAMPDGGLVRIATENGGSGGGKVVLAISDTGTGMPPEIIGQALQPFFTTKTARQGSGLGLSIVRDFVRRSDGTINLFSKPGEGTTVRLAFPAVPSNPVVTEGAGIPPVQERLSATVLVLEDNAGLRRIVVRQLEGADFRCLEAEDAKQAMLILEQNAEIDLLFADMILPGGTDGHTLARAARERWPRLGIVLTSAQPDAVAGSDMPVLAKPYHGSDLVRTLRGALSRQGVVPAAGLKEEPQDE